MHIFEQLENWKFYLIGSYPNGDLGGLCLNILIALVSLSISFFLGLFFGYGRLSRRKYIKIPCIAYVDTIRSIPLILILFWFYFFLPYVLGANISLFWSAVIALSVYASSYQAEIVRAGILAVPKGQLESGLSTGMSRYQAMGFIVLPQAFRMMIPSFVSFFISLFKDTAVVYIIGILELTQAGIIISQRQPDRMYTAYLYIAIGFWTISYGMSHVARSLERRMGTLDYESVRPNVSRDEYMLIPKDKDTVSRHDDEPLH
jgi:polar amino acid transport system permease protein